MGATLEAKTSTKLVRNTVHEQYTGRAFGFFMLNQLVPIIITVPKHDTYQKAVLVWGSNTQKFIPFSDLGKVSRKCVRVFLFNVRHYVKCYLPNKDDTAYTYNLCKYCGAKIKDPGDGYIRQIYKLNYRRNKYIYQPTHSLQNETSDKHLFSYQDRLRT